MITLMLSAALWISSGLGYRESTEDVFNGLLLLQVEAMVYQTVKDLVKQQFVKVHTGLWKSKKLVDCFSAWALSFVKKNVEVYQSSFC